MDGLILLGEPAKAYYRKVAQAGTPVVFLDFYDEQANADAVAGDNAYGTYRLTSHLIRRGHRKIGFVGSLKATSSIMDRFLGYYRAMLLNDLPVREDWIIPDRGASGVIVRPADISVTGFDDYPVGSENEIPLSTFRIDTDGMIRLAIKTLLDRCAGEMKPFGRFVISGQPVYRNSETEIQDG